MIDLEKTAHHKVYKTTLMGDTLVVDLQGDAPGFGVGSVQTEMSTLVAFAKEPEIRNLIIDLSGSNYYGSLILGEIINLGQVVREKGGRVALAGVSHDMHEILRMMRLDAIWERYPSRAMAIRSLADIPIQEKLKHYIKPVGILVGAIAILLAILFVPRRDYSKEYYAEMEKYWLEAQKMHEQRVSDPEWEVWNKKVQRHLDSMTSHLGRMSNSPAAFYLVQVTRNFAGKAFEHHLDPSDLNTISAEYFMQCAKAELEKSPLPPLPKELKGTQEKPEAESAETELDPNSKKAKKLRRVEE